MSRSEFVQVRNTNLRICSVLNEPVYSGSDVEYTVTGLIVKSYNMIVAVVCDDCIFLTPNWDYSRTTTKHVMEIVRTVCDATPSDLRKALLGKRQPQSKDGSRSVYVYRIFCTGSGTLYV